MTTSPAHKNYGDIDPALKEIAFVAKYDAERKIRWQWEVLCNTHRDFWKGNGQPWRHPPNDYFDKDRGKAGWFFPAKWVNQSNAR